MRRPEDNARSFACCADLPISVLNLKWVNQRTAKELRAYLRRLDDEQFLKDEADALIADLEAVLPAAPT